MDRDCLAPVATLMDGVKMAGRECVAMLLEVSFVAALEGKGGNVIRSGRQQRWWRTRRPEGREMLLSVRG